MKSITAIVYGADGHRQKISFQQSFKFDFSTDGDTRIIEVECADKTGSNDYVIVEITRNTESECIQELNGQITDGIFENAKIGEVYTDVELFWDSGVLKKCN